MIGTRAELARKIVMEFETQASLAQECGVSQPAVSHWLRRGIPRSWELYLRERFPHLKAWNTQEASHD